MQLSIGLALLAGLVSFISPCVLPVVPAYLGQLGVLVAHAVERPMPAIAYGSSQPALAGGAGALPSSGAFSQVEPIARGRAWRTLPNALAFVAGFGTIFTLSGLLLSVLATPLRDNDLVRWAGGLLVVLLGLNLMGFLRLSRLNWSWRPLDRFTRHRPGAERRGILGGLTLGAIFAVGWTPCIGPTLGAVLTLAASGPSAQVAVLLVAYSLGLGIPFVLMALAVDRAPAIARPLLRHGRSIEIVGGALVVVIGVAICLDQLAAFARGFSFLWPQV